MTNDVGFPGPLAAQVLGARYGGTDITRRVLGTAGSLAEAPGYGDAVPERMLFAIVRGVRDPAAGKPGIFSVARWSVNDRAASGRRLMPGGREQSGER